MWQEGQQEENEDLFDDESESFVLCALHQAKIIRERWKFWSGSVPASVSIRLHRLESLLSVNEEVRQQKPITRSSKETMKMSPNHHQEEKRLENDQPIPLQQMSKIDSSQPFLAEIRSNRYFTERMEPKHNIIIQGPDLRRIEAEKRRVHFWCCH